MAQYRLGRMAEEVKKEVADIIANQIQIENGTLVSVLKTEVSGDLKHAKVYLSSIGDKEAVAKNLQTIQNAAGFIRHELSKRLKVRTVPELHFIDDDSIAHSIKIAKIIEGLEKE